MVIDVCECACPNCGASEVRERNEDGTTKTINIRGFKVCDKNRYWWSQCLVCAGYYDEGRNPSDDSWRDKGWF